MAVLVNGVFIERLENAADYGDHDDRVGNFVPAVPLVSNRLVLESWSEFGLNCRSDSGRSFIETRMTTKIQSQPG